MGLFDKRPVPKEGEGAAGDERAQLQKEIAGAMEKYKNQLDQNMNTLNPEEASGDQDSIETKEYQEFKEEYMPGHMSFYEKACNQAEKLIKIHPPEDKHDEIQGYINICHLNITPTGVYSLSFLAPIALALVSALFGLIFLQSMFFVVFFFIFGYATLKPMQGIPKFMANSWRMKASNQMVLGVFYVVTYMRHTSNLELAIAFASDHLSPPLSLDFRKVLWDIETGKYEGIKESLDAYLMTWKEWAPEFVEGMHLIESSLYEGEESRRVEMLDKSLATMLDQTYEKMLHYAQNLKSPMTMLHMMGVILPILGLVILPLVVSFMSGIKWWHLSLLYNVALPAGVFYLAMTILATRPSGYGDSDISNNPEIKKFKKILIKFAGREIRLEPLYICLIFFAVFVLIGLSPILIHMATYDSAHKTQHWDLILNKDWKLQTTNKMVDNGAKLALLEYRISKPKPGSVGGEVLGPFGLGASMLSLCLIIGIGVGFGLYFKLRSKNVIKIRQRSQKLEQEFASALYQLGNRIGDGIPAEIAFSKVAQNMEGSVSGEFFQLVSTNISRGGMGVEQAIFDPEYGALVHYPSSVIDSSMKVLTESAKKGPKIAAAALINVSNYLKEMHKVNERLKDLLADIVASMRSQVKFMAPVISGIVIGITSMITTILGKVGAQMKRLAEGGGGGLLEMFGDGVPTYYFQFMVGLYVVQIVYILSIMTNGIENGSDELNERYMLGHNLVRSIILYVCCSGAVMLLFNILAVTILKGIAKG